MIHVMYVVIDTSSSYNIIIKRLGFKLIGSVLSTIYLSMNYPLKNGCISVI